MSKLDVKLTPTVLPTNGVTKENVKTHVQIHPPVAKMHNVLLGITKDCVVVLLVWLETQELNVLEMWMSVYQIPVGLMPGKETCDFKEI